jgi:holo-[acyl-carrier protein] synthase
MIVGLGIDIIEIARIGEVFRKYPDRFPGKILTEQEQAYCRQFADPLPEIAARFAAKEAFSKAIGTGMTRGTVWKDIEVIKEPGKPPRIHLNGEAKKWTERLGINNIHLSLTHTEKNAAAVVTVEKV